MGTHYYCTFERRMTASGDYSDLQGWLNSGKTGTPEIDLSVLVPSGTTHRYGFAADGYNLGTTDTIEFIFENLNYSRINVQGFQYLYTHGVNTISKAPTLFMTGWAYEQNTYTSLHTFGGTEGWYWKTGDMPLYINDGGVIGDAGEFSATLYLYNNETSVAASGYGTLYMERAYETASSGMTLVLPMDTIDSGVSFYIQGAGTADGFFPDTDTIPLFLNRENESDAISLYLHNNWIESNTYAPLYTKGVLGYPSGTLDLVFPDIIGGIPNSYTNLYIQGVEIPNSGIPLVMPDTLEEFNDNMNLVCYHGGAEPNTYCTLYIDGVYTSSSGMNLVIPDIIGESNQSIILSMQGY